VVVDPVDSLQHAIERDDESIGTNKVCAHEQGDDPRCAVESCHVVDVGVQHFGVEKHAQFGVPIVKPSLRRGNNIHGHCVAELASIQLDAHGVASAAQQPIDHVFQQYRVGMVLKDAGAVVVHVVRFTGNDSQSPCLNSALKWSEYGTYTL
jgi:hypothetical protein